MPTTARSTLSSEEQLAAAREAEAATDRATQLVFSGCAAFAAVVAARWGSPLQGFLVWLNNGNGNCALHGLAHAMGYLERSGQTLSPDQVGFLRSVLSSAVLCYIYQGKFRHRGAFENASREEQQLTGVAQMIAERRAALMELEIAECLGAETRNTTWPQRMVRALDQRISESRAQLPAMVFSLIAELEGINVVVLQRDDGAQLQVGKWHDQPLSFTPRAGEASRTVFLLHCICGAEDDAAQWVSWTDSNGVACRGRRSGNHYVYLHDAAAAEPQMQAHQPGSPGWRLRMRAGMDRVVALARAGTPSEQLSQQEEAQRQLQEQEAQRLLQEQEAQRQQQQREEQRQQQEREAQHQLREQEAQRQQQQRDEQRQQQEREAQRQQQQKDPQRQPQSSKFKFTCCMCQQLLELAPIYPGATLAAHHKSCHKDQDGEPLIQQIKALCAELASSAPQPLVKWAQAARTCSACHGVQASHATQCTNCRRRNPYSKQPPSTSPTANTGSGKASGTTSNSNSNNNGDTNSNRSTRQRTAPSVVQEPTWTQNDCGIAAVLDSVTEEQMVKIRVITSSRVPRTSRQRRQSSAVMDRVTKLLNQALDERRESAAATEAGAGVSQAAQAELSVRRAVKLLWFVPLLAYGRQMQGKGVKPKERMDALYGGTFAASLQQFLKAHLPACAGTAQQPQQSQQPTFTATAQRSPVSDADQGHSSSDRILHESCARLAGQRGGVAQAARKLEAKEQHAPADEHTQQVLRDKHPVAGSRPQVTDSDPETVRAAAKAALERLHAKQQTSTTGAADFIEVTEENVKAALDNASAGKASGPDGLRFEHLWAALVKDSGSAATSFDSEAESAAAATPTPFTASLAAIFTTLLNTPTLLPEESWRLLRAANLSGIGDKRRPIACASVWRRLMASIAARKVGKQLGPLLQQLSQLGCGVPSGVEHVATTTRLWQQSFGAVIQLDCANAFNSVDRLAIIKGLERFCPQLLPYFEAVYCGATMPEMRAELRKCDGAQSDAVYITLSELGCQQGDPLGPLLFAVAIAHALNPEDDCNDPLADSSDRGTEQSNTEAETVGRHVAYLDDLNLLVNSVIDTDTADRVHTTQRRLASIGLMVNMTKSLAVAQQGHTFSDAERLLLQELQMPFVDAGTPEYRQGFVTVGVPVGTKRYVEEQLRKKLLERSLWRLAWQLIGMAETNLQAAMIIFRGSFTHRFGYIARNVDPRDSAVWLSGFDGLCAWVLEKMLHLHGSTSAAAIEQDIMAACLAGDCEGASNPHSLVMRTAGPTTELQALPLKVARLKQGAGGLGLPNQGMTCTAAYVAQLQVTLKPSLEHVMNDTEQAPEGFAQYTGISSYKAAVSDIMRSTDLPDRLLINRGPSSDVTQWACDDSLTHDDQAALDAVMAEPLRLNDKQLNIDARQDQGEQTDDLSTAQQNNNAVPGQQSSNSDETSSDDSSNRHKGLQRRLTTLYYRKAMQALLSYLLAAGDSGRLFLAQLRSQRAPFAMAWLGYAGLTEMSNAETITMLLISLGMDPFGLQSSDTDAAELKCCFCKLDRPTAVHMMGCAQQHIRGHNAVHTGQKRCWQNCLKGVGFNGHEVHNEKRTCFTVPVGQQQELQADTVLERGSMALCGDEVLARQGIAFDSSITAATTATNIDGAAAIDGYACARREAEKHRKHNGRYIASRWKFVPFVQEVHGRLGKEAAEILSYIATEASQRSGGSKHELASKRSRILISLKSSLSTSLAMQMAQRIFGHVRGSAVHGQYAHPISSLLSLREE